MTEYVYTKTVHTATDVVRKKVVLTESEVKRLTQLALSEMHKAEPAAPAHRTHEERRAALKPQTEVKSAPDFSLFPPRPPKKKLHHELQSRVKKYKPHPPCAHIVSGGLPSLGARR
jgi:hypothetical protein